MASKLACRDDRSAKKRRMVPLMPGAARRFWYLALFLQASNTTFSLMALGLSALIFS
eukprot:CAMPEP_0116967766 /NCGR_PEP_ID=MMETSP0467-20121206/50779_1 /TAXON_ID=283647 /ORGANISM="Mesodinium pulex, Strain SPMC105" /LENGTH=56 /DNA_ID=CAMNT_0004657803 /DNA_START=164 /DNA_END=330 /DNA_ORIENTATION=+